MPSRAYTSFLRAYIETISQPLRKRVNALSGLYLISTMQRYDLPLKREWIVSMPSRAYTSFLRRSRSSRLQQMVMCQCPLGLIPHFYSSISHSLRLHQVQRVNALSGLYLISTVFCTNGPKIFVFVSMPSRAYTSFLQANGRTRLQLMLACQCPLGLIPHFYSTTSKT